MFYKSVLRVVHAVVDVVLAVLYLLNLSKFIDYVLIGRLFKSQFAPVKQDNVQKIPNHIGFIIAEDDISFTDLANLVIWSMTAGISSISLYDHNGVIKENKEAFLRQLSSKDRVFGLKNNLHFKSDPVPNLVLSCQSNKQALIKVYSQLDGKWAITNAANSICQQVQNGQMESAKISAELIMDRLLSQDKNSEPDVIVVYGSVHSSLGFLPWHIRLSELFVLPTHHKLQKRDFNIVLDRFSNCQQRFGK